MSFYSNVAHLPHPHYHVLGGLHGCLPNLNIPTETLESAKQVMQEEIERDFDSFDLPDSQVTYSRDLTYATIPGNPGGNEYYEIVECEDDCQYD